VRTGGHIGRGAVVVLLALAGCRAAPVDADLHAVDAESRIAGIVAAERSDDPADLYALVEALGDDDAAVRLFAAEALRRRTGQDFGYSAYAPEPQRRQAAQQWHAYVDGRLTAAEPATPQETPRP